MSKSEVQTNKSSDSNSKKLGVKKTPSTGAPTTKKKSFKHHLNDEEYNMYGDRTPPNFEKLDFLGR